MATAGQLDVYYDPGTGKMWLDTGGDQYNGWAIPGVEALEHNDLSNLTDFGAITRSSTFFAGAEQVAQGGAAPQAGEVAILDFGTGRVRIDTTETVAVIESLVRSGNLRIDGVHAGDVTVFDSLASAASPPNSAMAAVSGGGQIDGNLVLMGRLRLEEPVTMTVTGEVILSEGYSLLFAGRAVSAVAQLDVADDFQLAAGDSTGEFTLLTADEGIDGVFGDLSVGDELGAGDLFVESLTYTENEVLISLGRSLPGDANRDGFVDVSDFNIWNQFKFSDETDWGSADFNGDGTTDVADFNVWNENKFTQANTIVPEPSGESLIFMALVAFAGYRRRA